MQNNFNLKKPFKTSRVKKIKDVTMNRKLGMVLSMVLVILWLSGIDTISAYDKKGILSISTKQNTESTIKALKHHFESVRLRVVQVINAEIKDKKDPLAPASYKKLAERLSQLDGIEWAEYSGDVLGTINIKVKNGGLFTWQHIKNTFKAQQFLPKDADFNIESQLHPKWNKDWQIPKASSIYKDEFRYYSFYNGPKITKAQFLIQPFPLSPGRPKGETNTFATRFPTGPQDVNFSDDDNVSCPEEGKIAIIDFMVEKEEGETYRQLKADGKLLHFRIKDMGEAAGFKVDIFLNDQINLSNFKKLESYKIIIIFGHGSIPSTKVAKRLYLAFPTLSTPEKYDPFKMLASFFSYHEAWVRGYITINPEELEIYWTPLLIKDLYKPKTEQLVIMNNCFSMLKTWSGYFPNTRGEWVWAHDPTTTLYNFGEAFMDAGVKVALGYMGYTNSEAVVYNTMTFFRRLLGGYYINDPPPPPHLFWPTCMSAQSYFRVHPKIPVHGPKTHRSVDARDTHLTFFTMYAVPEDQYFRKVCDPPNRHASLQSFMLRVGTPVKAFQNCWNENWSKGRKEGKLKDSLCNMGYLPTTERETNNAACAVKIARKVTNAILKK